VSGRGERMRANGPLYCGVMRLLKTTHHLLDIGRHLAPAHDNRPELKERCRDERIRESNRREVVMQVRATAAVQRVA